MSTEHIDYGRLAQDAAEAHLEALDQALIAEESGDTGAQWPETTAPYCGCTTCVVREVLIAAWPHLRAGAMDEVLAERET